ncbi:sperm flagellar protein 2 [Tachysurus vachellii]|uniref:sperm flagellar protein 2 n=1 Tax=Tachysurus vachellii TaxID=175792 RepID=UPI00296B222D|nr:sperm flagellar protein 2 [Tachysurus vachellii]
MSDILCRWLNSELRLTKTVEPLSLAKDFSNGYLLGEVLYKHQLQEDFHQFSRHSTPNAKLNNFTRLEPTMQLLGVPFDLSMAKAVMQGQQGAATRLLYQLYILLQKKTRLGLTATMLETMQPAGVAKLHRLEKHIYTQRLRMMVKREADVKMQKIAQRFDKRGRDAYSRSVMAELEREERRRQMQEQIRLQDIQKHRQARRKQQEIMDRIQRATVQIPKPPVSRSDRATGKHRQHHQPDAQNIYYQISEFEKNRMRPSPASCPASVSLQVNEEQMEEWNNAYVQKIRKRLEENALAREEREKRRRRVLIHQLHTHQTHEEMLREEQLIGRLMRQSQEEKRIAAQLMQIRQQKEVLRQNRILREKEIHKQRLRDFQQALEREAALLQQDKINREVELCKERELHKRLIAERAQSKHRKHLNTCREILEQIVDLATKAGEYRLLTSNLIPVKLMREWKELWLCGKPLYEKESSQEQEIELEKLQILNKQDYTDYTSMTGEWTWPEEVESRAPPSNNDILGHIVSHLRNLANPPLPTAPPPVFPNCTLRACVLGKVCSGKTTCLNQISQAHGIHVLSVDALIQEALNAHRSGDPEIEVNTGSSDSPQQEAVHSEESEPPPSPHTEPGTHSLEHCTESLLTQHGAAVEEALKAGKGVPDCLLIDIITDAIRKVPSGQGWVLDGFPVALSQAHLLEKALGGADMDQVHTEAQDKSHELAVDRNAPQAPPPTSPVLNLALLLEVSDEQVLERYQHIKELEINPEHIWKRQEQTQVQHRILGFQDAWPGLEEWYGVEQKILVKVNGDVDEETLYRTVETVLLHVMDTAEKESQTQLHTETDDPSENTDIQKAESDHCDDSRRLSPSSLPIAEAPPSEPGSSSWVYVDNQLSKEMAEYLLSQWENICCSYVSNIKAVLQNLRKERDLIIHHIYNIREEYKQYLMRPDLKQEFVCAWQHEYNSVSEDIRHEVETKSELHQRLEDLRERLWDICDKRREEAMQEKAALTEDGWLENHTSVLINHYCTLIQVEVDRFQYTLHLLRDYYSGLYKVPVHEAAPEFTSVTLLDITNEISSQLENTKSSEGSAPSEKLTKSAGKKDTETEDKKKPRVPSSTDSKQKEYVHPGENLLQDFHQSAVTAVTQTVKAEMQQLEQEENEVLQQQMKTEPAHTEPQTVVPTTQSVKDKKKGAKKKGPPSPTHEPPVLPPPVEEDAGEVQNRPVRNRMKLEYRAALKHEESSVCERLERVKLQCVETLQILQTRTEEAHREMEEWCGAHFLSEVNSIDQLAVIIRHHIESGSRITHELTLACNNLFIDGDTRVVVTPPPSPHPLPTDVTNQDSLCLTVQQLYGLHSNLLNIAPTGLVSCDILHEVLTLCVGSDVLSKAWMQLIDSQDCGMVDWRQFLLSAARPWPLPSQTQLINTLTRFKEIDTAGGGVITLQQYLQVELWFPTQTEPPVPDDRTDPQPYDRLTNLRKFFFTLFSDSTLSPPVCDYMKMLLYFCSHPDPTRGFTRALSLVTQHRLPYTPINTTGLLRSYVCDDEEEEVFEGDEGDVSVEDVLRVVKHGDARISSQQHTNAQNTEELQQDLEDIFQSLGFKPEDKIPFRLLAQQSVLQELMDSSQYLLADFSRILEIQQSSSVEHPANEITSNTSPGAE